MVCDMLGLVERGYVRFVCSVRSKLLFIYAFQGLCVVSDFFFLCDLMSFHNDLFFSLTEKFCSRLSVSEMLVGHHCWMAENNLPLSVLSRNISVSHLAWSSCCVVFHNYFRKEKVPNLH